MRFWIATALIGLGHAIARLGARMQARSRIKGRARYTVMQLQALTGDDLSRMAYTALGEHRELDADLRYRSIAAVLRPSRARRRCL